MRDRPGQSHRRAPLDRHRRRRLTGPYVYITDQNHSYADPDLPIGRQWPVNAPVRIGAGTWLGTGVIVLPGAVIGRNVVVAAGSVVRGEIGDRCVVGGVPARVIKDFDPETGWTRSGSRYPPAEVVLSEVLAADPPPGAGGSGPALPDPARPDPVAAEPVLAEPVLAGAAVAEPVLAEPVLAEPVLAGAAVAESMLAEPVLAGSAVAGSAAAEPSLADLLLAPAPSEQALHEPLLTDRDS